jgi:beta-glucosidase
MDAKIEELIKQMTLEEKVSLCSGADSWHTRAINRLGIPAIRMTDGPHGVRRPYDNDETSWPANSYPTASAMAATWNTGLAQRVAEALGKETKSKGCDILLGPAINIHRTPLCGRNFEYYSEDPYLAGRMAVAYIQGLQSQNVGASLKHYACNNSEFERFTLSSEIDERTLREIYLPAFQAAVEEAQPWTVMCSYNKINGTWASENRYLLTDILRSEWGFQGFVVSDWGAVHNRILSSNAGLDLEMPGLGEMPTQILMNAVRQGQVEEAVVDEIVRRILRVVFLARGDGQSKELDGEAANTEANRALAREAAGESIVLLKNEGSLLPLGNGKLRSIAVFGPNADVARIQGGGSAQVNPYYTISPLQGIRTRAGEAVKVEYSQGCKNNVTPPVLDGEHVYLPASEADENRAHGFQAAYYAGDDFSGEPVIKTVEQVVRFSGKNLPDGQENKGPVSVRWQGVFDAPITGEYVFSLSSAGQSRLLVDGELITDHWNDPNLSEYMAVWPWRSKTGSILMTAGKSYDLVIEYKSVPGWYRLNAGYEIPLPADELQRVARLASQADVAVVCVGTTYEHETEGFDRVDWELPGDQARLLETVARANPRTVVVLTNGSPLGMAGWVNKVPAVLEAWFNGQETGNAIADVLFGDVNPSGKLPDTYPVYYQDNPSFINYPGENGQVRYGEGLFVGYRYYDAKDIEPLFPFGYGLSYTSFTYENVRVSVDEMEQDGSLNVSLTVRNSGTRSGKEVVQLYVRDEVSRLVRPSKELKGFQKVDLAGGESKTVTFTITAKELSYYDPGEKAWVAEQGVFELLIGSSSRDIRGRAKFTLKSGPPKRRARLNRDSSVGEILADDSGRAVLERMLPDMVNNPHVSEFSWVPLSRISMTFMDLLPVEKVEAIEAELASIE